MKRVLCLLMVLLLCSCSKTSKIAHNNYTPDKSERNVDSSFTGISSIEEPVHEDAQTSDYALPSDTGAVFDVMRVWPEIGDKDAYQQELVTYLKDKYPDADVEVIYVEDTRDAVNLDADNRKVQFYIEFLDDYSEQCVNMLYRASFDTPASDSYAQICKYFGNTVDEASFTKAYEAVSSGATSAADYGERGGAWGGIKKVGNEYYVTAYYYDLTSDWGTI